MQFSTNEFNYHDGTFSAEASDFGDRFNGLFSKVHGGLDGDVSLLQNGDSLLDEGFELVSERTGDVVKMVVIKCHRDREGELTHWEFRPHRCDKFANLIVFND